LEKSLI